jgi:hypothetical protein
MWVPGTTSICALLGHLWIDQSEKGQGPVVQNYVITTVSLKHDNYIISFSYSIQNYVGDQRVISPNETYEME